jgi:hypothetical protein
MTPEAEIRKQIANLEGWVVQISSSMTELHELVVAIARAGEEADKRIALLAEAQTRTEETLQRIIERGRNGH